MEHLGNDNLLSLYQSKTSIPKKLFEQMGEYFAKIHLIRFENQDYISNKRIQKKSFYEMFDNEFETNLRILTEVKGITFEEVKRCQEIFSKF